MKSENSKKMIRQKTFKGLVVGEPEAGAPQEHGLGADDAVVSPGGAACA